MKKFYIAFFSIVILGISSGIYYVTAHQSNNYKFADVPFTTINNESFSYYENPPKLRLVEFMYVNCPDVCPTTTFKMNSLKESLMKKGYFGNEIEFLTITIDPEYDTNNKLEAYATTFDMNEEEGWYLLKTDLTNIKNVTSSLGFAYESSGGRYLTHSTKLYLLDGNGDVLSTYIMGKQLDDQKIIKDIESSLEDL